MPAGEDWFGLAGHVARAQGEFAASQGDWVAAAGSLDRAILNFREYRLPWEEARALEARSRVAAQEHDSQTALQNVEAALAIYREHGAGHLWIDRVNAARNQTWVTPTATEGPSEATASSTEATASISTNLGRSTFRLEGEYWTLSYQGDVFRLRDTKGLQYIAYLLRHPGQQVLSIELSALSAGGDSPSKGNTA